MSAYDFLTAACRVWLGVDRAPVAGGSGLDAAELERLAFLHGLEPLLHHLLAEEGIAAGAVPPSLAARWEGAFFQNLFFNGEALALAAELTAAFAAADRSVAVFKGPVTLAQAYGHVALRPMVDLDLLCREEDLAVLTRLAAEHGFGEGRASTVHHLTFTRHEPPLGLDLHFALYDFLPGGQGALDRLLRGAEEVELEGHRLPALAPPAAFALDVAHLVNHDFRVGLRSFLDLAAQARRRRPALAGSAVAAEVRRLDLAPELALAAAVVDRLFGVRLPGAGASLGHPAAESEGDAAADLARVEAALRTPTSSLPALTGLGQQPGWGAKLGYARRVLFPPRRRLAALGAGPPSRSPGAAGARHFVPALLRVVRRWRSEGLAPTGAGRESIKRRVYERRRRSAKG